MVCSKDTPPSNIIAVYRNMQSTEPKRIFTVGINDDVWSLFADPGCSTPEGIVSCKFWGLGSMELSAHKNAVKIIGDHTDMNVQAYFLRFKEIRRIAISTSVLEITYQQLTISRRLISLLATTVT